MADGLTIEGSNPTAEGESIGAPTTPYVGVQTVIDQNPVASNKPSGSLPIPSSGNLKTGQGPGSAQVSPEVSPETPVETTPASQTAAESPQGDADKFGAGFFKALEERGLSLGGYETEESLYDDIAEIVKTRGELPTQKELEEYRQFKDSGFGSQSADYLKWLSEQGNKTLKGGDGGSGADSSLDSDGHGSASTSEKTRSLTISSLGLKPLDDMEKPTVDSGVSSFISQGQIVQNEKGWWEPSDGHKFSQLAVAAAGQKNEEIEHEVKVIQMFRDNPQDFIQRSMAPIIDKVLEMVEGRFSPTQEAVENFENQRAVSEIDGLLKSHFNDFFEISSDGEAVLDAKTGYPVQTELGNLFAHQDAQLMDSIPDENTRYTTILGLMKPLIDQRRSSSAKPAGAKPEASKSVAPQSPPAVNEKPAEVPPPEVQDEPRTKSRRLSLAQSAKNAARETTPPPSTVPGRTPSRFGERNVRLSLHNYVK